MNYSEFSLNIDDLETKLRNMIEHAGESETYSLAYVKEVYKQMMFLYIQSSEYEKVISRLNRYLEIKAN